MTSSIVSSSTLTSSLSPDSSLPDSSSPSSPFSSPYLTSSLSERPSLEERGTGGKGEEEGGEETSKNIKRGGRIGGRKSVFRRGKEKEEGKKGKEGEMGGEGGEGGDELLHASGRESRSERLKSLGKI